MEGNIHFIDYDLSSWKHEDDDIENPGKSQFFNPPRSRNMDVIKGTGSAFGAEYKIVDFDDLPDNVRDTFENYDRTGWKGNYHGQPRGTRSGKVYENDNHILPTKDSSGKSINYKEYDVNGRIPGQSRDGERFVVGSDGSIYYTDSHYGDGISLNGFSPFARLK